MSLRARIALLVGATVLLASAVGGIGTALSSRTVGRDRIDQQLIDDATVFPADAPRLGATFQRAFEIRRATCDTDTDADTDVTDTDTDLATDTSTTADNGRRAPRFIPEFASAMQVVRSNGSAIAACLSLPINAEDSEIASSGEGTMFRTVTIEGERFRVLTQGYGDLGAVQFARSLELTEATLRGLVVRILGFGLAGAVVAGALGWFFAKRATEPVERLSATAQRVAQTRDLGERIDVEGDAEIRAVADSFNTMLASLDTSRAQQQQLVQDASHELRTPLTSMRTNVELLQRHDNIDGDVRQQVLADINAELAELTNLTAELVESATEVPTTIQITSATDLVEIVTQSVERGRRRHRRTIELQVDGSTDSVVAADPTLLDRAITNLINNAVKFSESDTPVEVVVRDGSVTVLDRGPGLDDADLPLIFDRFFRATAARSAPGSGLGLAIVKQIVEGHNGTVRAANRQGGGAQIGFDLPSRPAT